MVLMVVMVEGIVDMVVIAVSMEDMDRRAREYDKECCIVSYA